MHAVEQKLGFGVSNRLLYAQQRENNNGLPHPFKFEHFAQNERLRYARKSGHYISDWSLHLQLLVTNHSLAHSPTGFVAVSNKRRNINTLIKQYQYNRCGKLAALFSLSILTAICLAAAAKAISNHKYCK